MPRRKAAAAKPANPAANTPHEAAIAEATGEGAREKLEAAYSPEPPAATNDVQVRDYDPEKHITINGKVYERDAFSQEQVQQISTVNFADQQIMNASQLLNIQKLGRDQLVKELLTSIEEVPFIGTVEAEE